MQCFHFRLKPYDRVWTQVFKDNKWFKHIMELYSHTNTRINPVLIGKDLEFFTSDEPPTRKPRLFLTGKAPNNNIQMDIEILL